MNSPFNNKFMSKSPLKRHKALQRKLKKAKAGKIGAEGQGGVDYELVSELEKQIPEAKAEHSSKRTEEGDAQVREDEDAAQGSAVEMKSPLHGYADASDMVDSNPSTAHMWNKVFDSMTTAGLAIVDAKAKKQKDKKFNEWLKKDGKDFDTSSSEYLAKYTEIYGAQAPTKSTS